MPDLADNSQEWDNIYTEIARQLLEGEDLSTDALYNKTATQLVEAMHKGFGGVYDDGDSRKKLQDQFNRNIEQFSYAKTLTQFHLFKDAMFNDKGQIQSLATVKKIVADTGEVFNNNYLRAEHSFVTQTAIMANKWETLDSEYLEFTTVGDTHVRQEHKLFDKFTALKSDPIWKRLYTPLDWGCRCTVIPGIARNVSKEYDSVWANKVVDPLVKGTIFDNNAALTGVVFTDKHPYFKVRGGKKLINREPEYKQLSNDSLNSLYNQQTINSKNENIIMNKGYVASNNSFDINENLRSNNKLSQENKKIVKALDSLINTNKLKENILLYRNDGQSFIESHFGVSITGLDITTAIRKIKDTGIKTIADKGFLSTSAIKNQNVFNFRKIHSEIRAKKETNAFVTSNYIESEIILGRNQKIKIIDIIKDGDKIKIIMETE